MSALATAPGSVLYKVGLTPSGVGFTVTPMDTVADTTVFNIRLAADELKELKQVARDNYRTAAAEARLAITKHLKDNAIGSRKA